MNSQRSSTASQQNSMGVFDGSSLIRVIIFIIKGGSRWTDGDDGDNEKSDPERWFEDSRDMIGVAW